MHVTTDFTAAQTFKSRLEVDFCQSHHVIKKDIYLYTYILFPTKTQHLAVIESVASQLSRSRSRYLLQDFSKLALYSILY